MRFTYDNKGNGVLMQLLLTIKTLYGYTTHIRRYLQSMQYQ